jgi:hypothetical protein
MTYFVSSFVASSSGTGCLVGDDADAGVVHVAENVFDFADKDLIFCVDHTCKEGNTWLVDHGDDFVLTDV